MLINQFAPRKTLMRIRHKWPLGVKDDVKILEGTETRDNPLLLKYTREEYEPGERRLYLILLS